MGLIEGLSVLLSFVYLYYAIKNKAICFVFGVLASCLWAYESLFTYQLKFDAALQVFYVFMSLIGLYRWKYGGRENTEKPIQKYSIQRHGLIIIIGLVLTYIFIYGSTYVDAIARPKLDAFTTVFFVLGTLLLVDREINSWLYLVICNIVMVYVYTVSSAWLFAFMMICYTCFGVIGYLSWSKEFKYG